MIADRPPHRSVRALISAYGSYLGYVAAKRSTLLSAHPPDRVTRVPRSVSGACWPDECSPRSAAFPPHSPPSTSRFCSNDSSALCRCPTPRLRACGSYGLSLHPPSCCWLGSRRLRGLPVLVHKASRRVWGLRLRRTVQELAMSLPPILPSAQCKSVSVLIASFRSSIPSPPVPLFTLRVHLAYPTQNSGPSGSLLLSRRTLPFPASCRFIPAHCIGDLSSIEKDARVSAGRLGSPPSVFVRVQLPGLPLF